MAPSKKPKTAKPKLTKIAPRKAAAAKVAKDRPHAAAKGKAKSAEPELEIPAAAVEPEPELEPEVAAASADVDVAAEGADEEADSGAEPATLASEADTVKLVGHEDAVAEAEADVPEGAAEPEGIVVDDGVVEMVLDAAALAEAAEAAQAASISSIASAAPAAEGAEPIEGAETPEAPAQNLEPIVESLLFASDKPLSVNELKRLLGVRDGKAVAAALESLCDRRHDTGIVVVNIAGGWQLRTNPAFGAWVGKLLAGKPVRLSRAMLETLAIIAYRQPVTRPELDEIRGVDCGPVLHTLLDRNLIRIIGKKEEVGRPILYGTTPEFLRVFSLKDLTELPTLRQFHELTAEHQAKVSEKHGGGEEAPAAEAAPAPAPATSDAPLAPAQVGPDPEEDDGLLDELDRATEGAARAAGPLTPESDPPAQS
jgi:segregation and condensation protein B